MKFKNIIIYILLLFAGVGLGFLLAILIGKEKAISSTEEGQDVANNNSLILNQTMKIHDYTMNIKGTFGKNNLVVNADVTKEESKNVIYEKITKSDLQELKNDFEYTFDYENNKILYRTFYNEELLEIGEFGKIEELQKISNYDSTDLLWFLSDIIGTNLDCQKNVCTQEMPKEKIIEFGQKINIITFNSYDMLFENDVKINLISYLNYETKKVEQIEIEINAKDKIVIYFEY